MRAPTCERQAFPPGRPKEKSAPEGLEPAAPSLPAQVWTGDRGEASRASRGLQGLGSYAQRATVGATLGGLRIAQADVQFAQLLFVHRAWGMREQVLGTLGFRESNHVAD
jgi:hypothetical protein